MRSYSRRSVSMPIGGFSVSRPRYPLVGIKQASEAVMNTSNGKRCVPYLAVMIGAVVAIGVSAESRSADVGRPVQVAQYYPPPPPGYRRAPPRPPCTAYGEPFRGAARGAAGGAIFGAIGGNAGTGAAIGAGIGLLGGAIRNSNARANGWCY